MHWFGDIRDKGFSLKTFGFMALAIGERESYYLLSQGRPRVILGMFYFCDAHDT